VVVNSLFIISRSGGFVKLFFRKIQIFFFAGEKRSERKEKENFGEGKEGSASGIGLDLWR